MSARSPEVAESKLQGKLKKYLWEGQDVVRSADEPQDGFVNRHRRLLSLAIPAVFINLIWWTYMAKYDLWHLFKEVSGAKELPRYYMSITVLFGSLISGSSSEGGGSIVFPVMTLGFGIKPVVARDFALVTQSVGMTSAAFAIVFMRVRTELNSLVFCSLGGIAGIIFGLEEVAPHLEPAYAKMYFVSIWFSFAFSLYLLNVNRGRRVFDTIPDFWEKKYNISWKPIVLFCAGFLGGIFSAISGSGIDICSFSVLTLVFRVSEKIATPTSVVLMGTNTWFGFLYRQFYQGGIAHDSWGYFAVSVPIVVIGCPLGSVIGSHFHRLVLAGMVYVTDTVQLIAALAIVKPWKKQEGKVSDPFTLTSTSAAFLVGGLIFFKIFEHWGKRLLEIQEERELQKNMKGSLEMN